MFDLLSNLGPNIGGPSADFSNDSATTTQTTDNSKSTSSADYSQVGTIWGPKLDAAGAESVELNLTDQGAIQAQARVSEFALDQLGAAAQSSIKEGFKVAGMAASTETKALFDSLAKLAPWLALAALAFFLVKGKAPKVKL